MAEPTFDEETFNLQVRKFLKKVGVNSQREIERAVQAALASGALKADQPLHAEVTLSIPALNLSYRIDDEIALS